MTGDSSGEPAEVTIMASRVRQNALSAAIAAALMIYFGFFALAEPTGTQLFDLAARVFYHTLRIGGIAMALIALWSLLGDRTALIVDGIASTVIGVLFVLAALGLFFGGGALVHSVLYVIFGSMFVSSGLRNYREYFYLARLEELGPRADSTGDARDPYPSARQPRPADTGAGPPTGIQFEPYQPQSPDGVQTSSAIGEVEVVSEQDLSIPTVARAEGDLGQTRDEPEAEPDSGGFLASFADEEPPPRI